MLARTGDVAVFLSGLRVHRNGVRFTVEVRTRTRLFENGDLTTAVHGQGRAALQLGVELSDGRRCAHDRRGVPDPTGPVLAPQSAGGSHHDAHLNLFLSPVPPPGNTRMFCAWPWFGIGDQVTLLPTDAILATAANVLELWPWEPPGRQREPVVARPETPDDSWFSSTRWPSMPC